MDLIPTRSKERLPAGYSYPVGAQAISAALAAVPFYADLVLSFYWKDEFWASEYQARIAAEGELVVLEADCWIEWRLRVKTLAAVVREALIGNALPELARVLGATSREPDSFHWTAGVALSSGELLMSPTWTPKRTGFSRRGKYRAPIHSRGR